MVTDAVRTDTCHPALHGDRRLHARRNGRRDALLLHLDHSGLIGWPTLARRVRTHLLTERNQEYVLAAQLCGASSGHVIRRHLLPSFTSYIIVDLVISFPYMVLSETAPPSSGWG